MEKVTIEKEKLLDILAKREKEIIKEIKELKENFNFCRLDKEYFIIQLERLNGQLEEVASRYILIYEE